MRITYHLVHTMLASMVAVAAPALAAANGRIVMMTPTTVNTALAALAPGDTLRMEGTFSGRLELRDRDFGGVTVDASRATMLEGMSLRNVQNIAFNGGTFGRTDADNRDFWLMRIFNSSQVSVANASVVGTPNGRGGGIYAEGNRFITVRDNVFDGQRSGVTMKLTTDSLVTNNQFRNSSSDGLQLVGSQRVIVSENSCSGTVAAPGAHPDCVQMWSNAGGLLHSDIYLLNNSAIGDTQGFVSFNPLEGAGGRITFAGNYAAISYPHGISCYGCFDSLITDNVLSTLPQSRHRVVIRTNLGYDNIVENNQLVDIRGQYDAPLPDRPWSFLAPSLAGMVGSVHASRTHNSRSTLSEMVTSENSVPEPATWVMMVLGFLMVGRQFRQQSGAVRVLC